MAAPNPSPAFSHHVRRTRRYKVETACDTCRRKKIKCDGIRPACSHCQKKPHLRSSCHYAAGGHGDRSRFLAPAPAPPSVPTSFPEAPPKASSGLSLADASVTTTTAADKCSIPAPSTPDLHRVHLKTGVSRAVEVDDAESVDSNGQLRDFEGGSVQAFTMRLKAAVDAKLGLPAGESPIFVPTTDAPLFLSPPRHAPPLPSDSSSSETRHLTSHVLPPRRQADHLVEVFFRNLDPIWPFLDRFAFSKSMDALFAGTLPESDEPVFLSVLNAVLAMAMQSQEHITPDERQRDSLAFFSRTWNLLHAPAVAWGPPSLERAEAFLLATLYLQCTNNPQDTWATLGHAVRIGQNLGLHLPESRPQTCSSGGGSRRRILLWRMIIFLEKQVSVSLARFPSVSEGTIYQSIASSHPSSSSSNGDIHDSPETPAGFLRKTLELYAVTFYHTPPSQSAPPEAYRNPFERRWNYGGGGEDDEQDHVQMALRMDGHVDKWKQKMPDKFKSPSGVPARTEGGVNGLLSVLYQIRIAHSRVILLRPMLAHLCLSQQPINPDITSHQSLRQRLIYDSACICIKNAQDIVSTLHRHHGPPSSTMNTNNTNNTNTNNDLLFLPWWIRLYYLHVAGTILITATLQPDISARLSVAQSWEDLVSVLEGHKHLSGIIPQYIERLRTLSDEVMQTRWSETPPDQDKIPQDVDDSHHLQPQQQQQQQNLYSDPSSLSMGGGGGGAYGVDDLFTSGFPFGFDDIFNLPNI